MKRLITLLLLGNISLAFAGTTLTVTNNIQGLEAYVSATVLCGSSHDKRDIRDFPLNPVKADGSAVESQWKHCLFLPAEYFLANNTSDFSRMYVKLVDTSNGDYVVTSFQAHVNDHQDGGITHHQLSFANRTVTFTLQHDGYYDTIHTQLSISD